jgi:xylogalacturonan beta-1,3-xylosyltransferase
LFPLISPFLTNRLISWFVLWWCYGQEKISERLPPSPSPSPSPLPLPVHNSSAVSSLPSIPVITRHEKVSLINDFSLFQICLVFMQFLFLDLLHVSNLVLVRVTLLLGQKKTDFERIEEGLAQARAAIYRAIRSQNSSSYKEGSYIPRGSMYRNQYAFHQLSFNTLFFS